MTNPPLPAATPAPVGSGPGPVGSGPAPVGSGRRLLRVLSILACLPYIVLKVAWVAGSEIGIPEGSVLLEHRGMMAAVNAASVLADAVVVLLALLLTQEWGRRVKAWLLAFPMWAATGLIGPIMIGYPAQLVVSLATGDASAEAVLAPEPFVEPWVFPVVYGGFIVQGLCLGTLFALYARDRWGRVWSGRLGELPAAVGGPVLRAVTVAAAAVGLVPAGLRLRWAAGSTDGLSASFAASYDSDRATLDVVMAALTVLAVLAVLLLLLRRPAGLRVRTTMALAWVASGAAGCWGAYMSLVALLPQTDAAKEPTVLMTTAYAGEMITGFLLAGCLAVVLSRRARGSRTA
ncbi:hypothetical protein [Streptomyces sp. NPDC059071]|uniref:hypothetical protein n=1 Tax=unclassified Streptomyces TaxID=2593676 RepID=UPI003665650E